MTLEKFLKSKGSLLALAIVLIYGIVIFAIYFTGYHAMPNSLNKLPVTVVNQDQKSKKLARQLKRALPFDTVKTTTNLSQAKKQLNDRKTYLIVDIPKSFKTDVSANKQVSLNFYVNDSNQTSVVSGMKSVAKTIGTTVNTNIVLQKSTVMIAEPALTKLQTRLKTTQAKTRSKMATEKAKIAAAPSQSQASLTARLQESIASSKQTATTKAATQKETILKNAKKKATPIASSVKTKIHVKNKVKEGLNYSLAPFITNLALYISALFGTIMLYGTYVKFAKQIGRFKSFINMEISMALIAIIGTAFVSWAVVAMMGLASSSFADLWITSALLLFSAYNFNAVLVLLLGQIGTALNTFLTMLQVVAGAGMVPVIAMNTFFKGIHGLMPMYYAVRADFNIMYGGTGTTGIWLGLLTLTFVTILINLGIVALRKHQPMLQFEQLS